MTPRQAHRLFARERARFARAFPWVAGARLVLLARPCPHGTRCRARSLAYAETEPAPHVVMVARALALPDANVVGLIRHELGHLADADRDHPGREQRADDIAEWVSGERINYDQMRIQTVGPGTWPRPLNLHR